MKKAEILFVSIILIGFIFRISHFPYASIILTCGILLLSLLYFFFGFAVLNNINLKSIFKSESYAKISKLRLLGGIATGFVFSMLVIYSLFKLQFWPFGNIGLLLGLKMFGVIFFIVLVLNFFNRKEFLKINYLRFIIIGVLSIILYTVSQDKLVDLYYGSDPEYAEEYKKYLKDDSVDAKRPTRVFNSN